MTAGARAVPVLEAQIVEKVGIGDDIMGLVAQLADQRSLVICVMNVMGQRAHVIKKLGVHRPATVLIPETVANQLTLQLVNGIFQQKLNFIVPIFENNLA